MGANEKVEATFHGGNTDPRVEAAARKLHERTRQGFDWDDEKYRVYQLNRKYNMGLALAAADEADRAAGIVRVHVDDETVERVARKLWDMERSEYDYEWELNASSYRESARTILAALRGES
jgi:hypothetical protein